jgi:hypothetical protein
MSDHPRFGCFSSPTFLILVYRQFLSSTRFTEDIIALVAAS